MDEIFVLLVNFIVILQSNVITKYLKCNTEEDNPNQEKYQKPFDVRVYHSFQKPNNSPNIVVESDDMHQLYHHASNDYQRENLKQHLFLQINFFSF